MRLKSLDQWRHLLVRVGITDTKRHIDLKCGGCCCFPKRGTGTQVSIRHFYCFHFQRALCLSGKMLQFRVRTEVFPCNFFHCKNPVKCTFPFILTHKKNLAVELCQGISLELKVLSFLHTQSLKLSHSPPKYDYEYVSHFKVV